MPRVYVVNKSSHDYSPAEDFGKIIYLSYKSLSPFGTSKLFRSFSEKLKGSEWDDFILVSGLSIMTAIACCIFVSKHKRLNLLIYNHAELKAGRNPYSPRTVVFNEEML